MADERMPGTKEVEKAVLKLAIAGRGQKQLLGPELRQRGSHCGGSAQGETTR
jgi:hypothetical protein